MVNTNLLRVGGIAGLLCVVVMIPAYLVGTPDRPVSTGQANLYFGSELGRFVFSNGTLLILHVFRRGLAGMLGSLGEREFVRQRLGLEFSLRFGRFGRKRPRCAKLRW